MVPSSLDIVDKNGDGSVILPFPQYTFTMSEPIQDTPAEGVVQEKMYIHA